MVQIPGSQISRKRLPGNQIPYNSIPGRVLTRILEFTGMTEQDKLILLSTSLKVLRPSTYLPLMTQRSKDLLRVLQLPVADGLHQQRFLLLDTVENGLLFTA